MNPRTIYYYSRQKFHHYKYRALQLSRQILPQKKQLVFSFMTERWAGMGCEMYAQEKLFRQYIQKCDAIICRLGGNSILPYFENKDPDFLHDESNAFFGLTSLHIAYYELLKSEGIIPNAVMGISLGEVAAVYAAGGLSLEDALKVTACCLEIHKKEKKIFIPIYIPADLATAEIISEKSPVDLPVFYEVSDTGILVLCRENEKDAAVHFLESQHIACSIPHRLLCYPYHTKLLLPFEGLMKKLIKTVEPRPLRCDFYSSLHGKKIPEGTVLENDYWFEEQCHPILMHSLLQQIEPCRLILDIGGSPLFRRHLDQLKSRQVQFFDSFVQGQSERTLYESAKRQLLKTKLAPSSLNNYKGNEVEQFTKKINFYDWQSMPDPLPYLKYLQKKGSVHYLPQHKEWLVLDYNDIEHVLKNPEVFSSTIHKTIDEFLFGADPPSHTLVRSLVQPLFSQQRFIMVSEFVLGKTAELLENLSGRPAFNFVDEFSLPLSQAAIAKFMGFTEEENLTIKQYLHGYPYDMKFLDSLKEYCRNYFENSEAVKTNTVASLLSAAVKEGKLPLEGAISVMRLLWFAGMITTSMLMSTAVLFLLKNPGLIAALKEDEQLLNKFIEECLRLDSPETETRRICTRETKLAGQILPAGAVLVLKLRAANRDPKYFENPDEIWFDRANKKHLAFGSGYHYCLGAGMARIETKAALKLILQRISEWKLDQRGAEYFPSNHFRAISELPVVVNGPAKESKATS